jgi:hypothetical protein
MHRCACFYLRALGDIGTTPSVGGRTIAVGKISRGGCGFREGWADDKMGEYGAGRVGMNGRMEQYSTYKVEDWERDRVCGWSEV